MRVVVENIKRTILILAGAGVIGTLLLFLVFCIPNAALQHNADGAWEIFKSEGIEHSDIKYITHFFGSKLIADSDMMRAVVANDESLTPIERAMDINGYARYWHGYLLILRPLLVFFSYGQFRYLMFISFAILIYLMINKLNKEFNGCGIGFGLLVSLILVHFSAVPFSLHVGITFFVAFLAVLYVLNNQEKMASEQFAWCFYLIIGALTSYVDFLTTPIVTLCFPLMIQILLDIRDDKKDNRYIAIIRNSVAWGIGYAVMWAEKWFIGSAILRKNVIADSMSEAKLWQTVGTGQKYNFVSALAKNIACMLPFGESARELIPFIVVGVLAIAVLVVKLLKRTNTIKNNLKKALPILFISLYPFIWILVMSNHSGVHATFWVYRILVITVFGMICFYKLIVSEEIADER